MNPRENIRGLEQMEFIKTHAQGKEGMEIIE